MRQSAIDDQGGAEIQVLVEGRATDVLRGGANSWTDEAYPERGGSSRSTTPSLLEEQEGQINGHEQAPLSNHRPREKASSNHKSYRTWEHSNQKPSKHALSNHKSREYSSSNHKTWDHSTNHKLCELPSSNYKPQVHILSNHKSSEHHMSNHKTSEHASTNHKSQDYISSNHNVKDHVASSHNPREHASSNHHPKQHNLPNHKLNEHAEKHDGFARGWTAESTLRWSPAHSRLTGHDEERSEEYTVDMRLQCVDSQTSRGLGEESPPPKSSRLRFRGLRPVREGSADSVQMLDNLNVGAELEEWPLHRDLTLSPALQSQPGALEQEGELRPLKPNSVSGLTPPRRPAATPTNRRFCSLSGLQLHPGGYGHFTQHRSSRSFHPLLYLASTRPTCSHVFTPAVLPPLRPTFCLWAWPPATDRPHPRSRSPRRHRSPPPFL